MMIRVSVEELDWSAESQALIPAWTPSGVTLNADLEPKIDHQTPMQTKHQCILSSIIQIDRSIDR